MENNKQIQFEKFVFKLCDDQKQLLTQIAYLSDRHKQYGDVLIFINSNIKKDVIYTKISHDIIMKAKVYA